MQLSQRCSCCRVSTFGPVFEVWEPGRSHPQIVCIRCATHVSLTERGSLFVPARCPDVLRPRLRIVTTEEARP